MVTASWAGVLSCRRTLHVPSTTNVSLYSACHRCSLKFNWPNRQLPLSMVWGAKWQTLGHFPDVAICQQ